MNLEEARNNIGAEVELDESTKPYTYIDCGEVMYDDFPIRGTLIISSIDEDGGNISLTNENGDTYCYLPRHLKLKPQNYKIHVPTEDESREAQELFFELGYYWYTSNEGDKDYHYDPYYDYILTIDGKRLAEGLIGHADDEKQITLQELRDMVKNKKYIKHIEIETIVLGDDIVAKSKTQKEMTWQDALRAVADGKEVEYYHQEEWEDVKDLNLRELMYGELKLQLAPKRIYLNGSFTKEELLQKIGEME